MGFSSTVLYYNLVRSSGSFFVLLRIFYTSRAGIFFHFKVTITGLTSSSN